LIGLEDERGKAKEIHKAKYYDLDVIDANYDDEDNEFLKKFVENLNVALGSSYSCPKLSVNIHFQLEVSGITDYWDSRRWVWLKLRKDWEKGDYYLHFVLEPSCLKDIDEPFTLRLAKLLDMVVED